MQDSGLNGNERKQRYWLRIVLRQKKTLMEEYGWTAKKFAIFCRQEHVKLFLKENDWGVLKSFHHVLSVEITVAKWVESESKKEV